MHTRSTPPLFTRLVDLIDKVAPDKLRVGDIYDLVSGRTLWHTASRVVPGLKPAEHAVMRRARSKDLTTSGLGFELLISYGGQAYNALVHLPPREHPAWRAGALRVVLDSHGFTDSPRAHSARSGLSEAIVQTGAISIALGGSRGQHAAPLMRLTRSHDGMCGPDGARFKDADGPALVSWLLDQVAKAVEHFGQEQDLPRARIDRKRTVAVGFSNGGALATTLAGAGVVSHAISFSGPTAADLVCKPAPRPMNVLWVEGRADPLVPPNGPTGPLHPSFLVAEQAASVFLQTNGSAGQRLSKRRLPGFLEAFVTPGVEVKAARSKEGGVVGIIRIDDNGHAVPGSAPFVTPRLDRKVGFHSSDKISGAELVTRFLEHVDAQEGAAKPGVSRRPSRPSRPTRAAQRAR